MTDETEAPWVIGDWVITDPDLVIKLAFVFETKRLSELPQLWKAAELEGEKQVTLKGKHFVFTDLFHQENGVINETVLFSNRWYTPRSNRRLKDIKLEGMQ